MSASEFEPNRLTDRLAAFFFAAFAFFAIVGSPLGVSTKLDGSIIQAALRRGTPRAGTLGAPLTPQPYRPVDEAAAFSHARNPA